MLVCISVEDAHDSSNRRDSGEPQDPECLEEEIPAEEVVTIDDDDVDDDVDDGDDDDGVEDQEWNSLSLKKNRDLSLIQQLGHRKLTCHHNGNDLNLEDRPEREDLQIGIEIL